MYFGLYHFLYLIGRNRHKTFLLGKVSLTKVRCLPVIALGQEKGITQTVHIAWLMLQGQTHNQLKCDAALLCTASWQKEVDISLNKLTHPHTFSAAKIRVRSRNRPFIPKARRRALVGHQGAETCAKRTAQQLEASATWLARL